MDMALLRGIHSELTTVKAISSVTFSGFPEALHEGEPARRSIKSNASYRWVPPWSCDLFCHSPRSPSPSLPNVLPSKKI